MSKRILISTQVFPPMTSGSAVILYELLRHLPQDDLVAVHGVGDPPLMNGPSLEMERHMALVLGSYTWTIRCHRRCPQFYVPLIRRALKHWAKAHAVQRIYAHFPSSAFLVAAFQAAESLDLPLTVYFDILWNELPECDMRMARKYERRILERADRRFAITEFAADFLTKKHGLPVDFLPHTIDLANKVEGFQAISDNARPTIHFCGGIYPVMNQAEIVRLLDAAGRAKSRPEIDLFAPDLPAELRQRGVQARYLPRGELRARATPEHDSVPSHGLSFKSSPDDSAQLSYEGHGVSLLGKADPRACPGRLLSDLAGEERRVCLGCRSTRHRGIGRGNRSACRRYTTPGGVGYASAEVRGYAR
jgi:hypothetical protein